MTAAFDSTDPRWASLLSMSEAMQAQDDPVRQHLAMLLHVHRGNNARKCTYLGPADFVLREGVNFTPAVLPDKYAHRLGIPKHCYDNAYHLARTSHGKLRYVEGYAQAMLAVHHAWTVDDNDQVVDPTWLLGNPDHPLEDAVYVGVPIPIPVIRAVRKATPDSVSLLQNYQLDYPAFDAPWTPDQPDALIERIEQAAARRKLTYPKRRS